MDVKGTVLIILPTSVDIDPWAFEQFTLPESMLEYLDGKINLMILPEGGSFHMGEKAVEMINNLYKEMHKEVKDEG